MGRHFYFIEVQKQTNLGKVIRLGKWLVNLGISDPRFLTTKLYFFSSIPEAED